MAVQGKKLNMALGFSHPVEVEIPEALEAKIEKNILTISGIDKQQVGQFAASTRALKKLSRIREKVFAMSERLSGRKPERKQPERRNRNSLRPPEAGKNYESITNIRMNKLQSRKKKNTESQGEDSRRERYAAALCVQKFAIYVCSDR